MRPARTIRIRRTMCRAHGYVGHISRPTHLVKCLKAHGHVTWIQWWGLVGPMGGLFRSYELLKTRVHWFSIASSMYSGLTSATKSSLHLIYFKVIVYFCSGQILFKSQPTYISLIPYLHHGLRRPSHAYIPLRIIVWLGGRSGTKRLVWTPRRL